MVVDLQHEPYLSVCRNKSKQINRPKIPLYIISFICLFSNCKKYEYLKIGMTILECLLLP